MIRHGTPMKARIDKKLTEKGARKRYEIDFSREEETEEEEAKRKKDEKREKENQRCWDRMAEIEDEAYRRNAH